jgi:hypothetical protein
MALFCDVGGQRRPCVMLALGIDATAGSIIVWSLARRQGGRFALVVGALAFASAYYHVILGMLADIRE